jgi:hypothetical protein
VGFLLLIDYELKFNSHNTNICRKASRQLNVLKRMGKYLNRLGKLTIYHSFILSNLKFLKSHASTCVYLKILKNKAKKYENNLKSCTEAAVT